MAGVESWKVEGIDPEEWGTSSYSTDDLKYDFQSTLDSWRTYEVAQNSVEQADEFLEEKYGGGVDFAAIYGSSVHGLTIFSDAALPRAHEPGDDWFDDSDIDMMIGLERPDDDIDEKQYRQDAASVLYEGHDDVSEYPEVKLHPLVEFSDTFVGTLSEAREDWLKAGGDPNEKITLRAQPIGDDEVYEVDRYWHDFLRCMTEGIAFSEEFYSEDFHNEFKKGRFVITEGDRFWDGSLDESDFNENEDLGLEEFYELAMLGKKGSKDGYALRQDLEFESSGLDHFESEPDRPDRLNRNFVYGLWERAKRRSDSDYPPTHDLGFDIVEELGEDHKPSEVIEQIRERKHRDLGDWPGETLAKGLMASEFTDRELAELYPGTLQSSKTAWVEDMKEENPELYEQRKQQIQDIFTENIEDVRRFFTDAIREDHEFSDHAPGEDFQDFDEFSDAVARCFRKDIPMEFFLVSDFAIDRIKSRYRQIESSNPDLLEKGIHEYSLEELEQLEQTELDDW